MMRVITGKARGAKLKTLEGETTRPTAERTKEAVFSYLQFDLTDRQVLDLFGGSGQMAIEALSRGAARAVIVDASKEAVNVIRENIRHTKLEAQAEAVLGDALDFIGRGDSRFDLVFLDPPYAGHLIPPALRALVSNHRLGPGCIIVCESAEDGDVFEDDQDLAGHFNVEKTARYGKAFVTYLTERTKQ